ncbi:MAG: adenylyltransferase/cytidyltransferase family protein [Candidatus Uhrbacteria bacterium]
MKRYLTKIKIGLIIGKFSPLHKGHQFLIETAIKKMDKVIVLVYQGPKDLKIPLKTRVGWIQALYPSIKVVSGRKAPVERGTDPLITKKNLVYVKQVIHMPITHIFSSEKYGQILSQALGAKNVLVDEKRSRFPVSGTVIRKNPKAYKKFLEPTIYQKITKSANR